MPGPKAWTLFGVVSIASVTPQFLLGSTFLGFGKPHVSPLLPIDRSPHVSPMAFTLCCLSAEVH